jgi:parallel beta-helix repeat protein
MRRKLISRIFSLAVFTLMSSFALLVHASDLPIIFLHGHNPFGELYNGFWTPGGYQTAMERIIENNYKNYTAGNPLNCNENTTIYDTPGNTRKIYNFSYYHVNGTMGAIGTNGRLLPVAEGARILYEERIANGCWAKILTDFINKVLTATGASKVDIVAHSMGGLVARSAIQYYDCSSKVRKLLMIGTPNHPFSDFWSGTAHYYLFCEDQWWMWSGEDLEMNVGESGFKFIDTETQEKGLWCDLLGYSNYVQETATIAGNRKAWQLIGGAIIGPDDGVVDVNQARLSGAHFHPDIYSSHMHWPEHTYYWIIKQLARSDESALEQTTYVEEFIKKWMIDDEEIKGAISTGDPLLYPEVYENYELRFEPKLDDNEKALVCLTFLDAHIGPSWVPIKVKAFPIYKYHGPLVFSFGGEFIPLGVSLRLGIKVYDMKGRIIDKNTNTIESSSSGNCFQAYIKVLTPNGGETIHAGNTYVVGAEAGINSTFMPPMLKFYYSSDGGNSWYECYSPPEKGESQNAIKWLVPNIPSTQCRIKAVYDFNGVDKLVDISDGYFTIPEWSPRNLTIVDKWEDEVDLKWSDRAENETGFEIRREKQGGIFERVGITGENVVEFSDEDGVEAYTTYYYKVRAFVVNYGVYGDDTVFSDFTSEVTVTTPWMSRPTDLSITPLDYKSLRLEWVDNSNINSGYNIALKEGNDWVTYDHLENSPNLNTYDATENINPNEYFLFKVIAFDDEGHLSDSSNLALVNMGGARSFTATGLDEAVYLEWGEPDIPFTTDYLIVRRENHEVSWAPVDQQEYSLGPVGPPGEGNIIVYISDGSPNLYFLDEPLVEGHLYYYAIFAFDGEYTYTEAETEFAIPTNFLPQSSLLFDMIGNNSRKLIETTHDSICIVYSENYSADFKEDSGRAQRTDHYFCSRDPQGNWNDPFLMAISEGGWNGITIGSTDEGEISVTYTYYNDLYYSFFLGFPFNFWVKHLLKDDHEVNGLYFSQPAMQILEDTTYIAYYKGNESGNDAVCFLDFETPVGIYGEVVPIDSQVVNSGGQAGFGYPSIAVCKDNETKYVHFVWWSGPPQCYYKPGHIWHRYGRLQDGILQWEMAQEIEVSGSGCHPSIVAGEGNSIYLVWNEKVGAHKNDKIYFKYFDGTEWSNNKEVYDLPSLGPSYTQRYYPVIVHNNGNVIVAWDMAIDLEGKHNILYSERNTGGNWTEPQNIWPAEADFRTPHITMSNDKSQLHVISTKDRQSMVFKSIDLLPEVENISKPSSGEDWHCGEVNNIEWVAKDNTENLVIESIEYSTNGGESWILVVSEEENDGIYEWTVPNTPSENCKIRITVRDHANNIVWGESGVFTISDNTAPEVTLISPNGGEYFNIGDTENIRWEATDNVGISSQHLYYSEDEGNNWEEIEIEGAIQQPNGEYVYSWEIPAIFSDKCRIKVETYDFAENRGEDISDYNFTIWDYESPEVTLVTPNGGENIEIGSTHSIGWEATDNVGIVDNKLYYSTNYGLDWITIPIEHPVQPGSYIYPWDVPETPSPTCILEVESYDGVGQSGTDYCDNLFKISWFISDNVDATGYSPKIVGNDWALHLVYSSQDSIYYSKSTDNGLTFNKKTLIGTGYNPTIVSDGESNIYILWTHENKVYYRRTDGTYWFPVVTLVTVTDVTETRQVFGVVDEFDNLQIAFEGIYTFGRAIERNIVYYGKMKKNVPGTFNYEKITETSSLDKTASISFVLDTDNTGYLSFSHDGRIYCYTNESGEWTRDDISELGCEASLNVYDNYLHLVWQDNGIMKHRQRALDGRWRNTEIVASESGKRFSHPVMDKGCIVLFNETPEPQPDNISRIVYSIKNRGYWQEKVYLTEEMKAGYPQVYIEKHRDTNATLYTLYTEGSFTPNSVELDKRDITIPHQTSDILQATAYNFQDKIVKDSEGVIHIVYQDRDSIMYAYSSDGGETFSEDEVLGQGRTPVISLLPYGNLGVLWKANSADKRLLYKTKGSVGWSEVIPLFRTEEPDKYILPPNFVVDEYGIGYIALELEKVMPGGPYSWWLYYGEFDALHPQPIQDWSRIDSLLDIPQPTPPPPVPGVAASSDLIVDNAKVHLLWSQPIGGIYYSQNGIIDWSDPVKVSLDIENSYHPSLSIYEGRLGSVWQGGNVPEIYYSFTDNYDRWSIPENISNTSTGSHSPVVSENAFILWSEENISGKTDIMLSCFDRAFWEKKNITESEKYSSYPHQIISGYPEAELGVLYTEGETHPYNVQYIKEDVIIPWHTSDRREATASNNQKKLIIDDDGTFHLVFESGGHIFYTTSTDGESWSLEEYLGEGISPAIALDSEEHPVCMWVEKPELVGNPYRLMSRGMEDGVWKTANPLYTTNYYIESPSFVVMQDPEVGALEADTGFVAFEHGYTFVPDEHSQIIFGWFSLAGFGAQPGEIQTEVVDDVIGARGVKTPSLSISGSTVHLAYERDYEIIYTRNYIRGMGPIKQRYWTTKQEVSPLGMSSTNPQIDCYGLGFNIVWEGDEDIYHIRCNLAEEPGIAGIREYWGETENVSQSPAMVSLSPVVCSGSQIMWMEKEVVVEPEKFRVYVSRFNRRGWTIPRCLTEGEVNEMYPQMLVKNNELFYVFTQGDEYPYLIKSNHTSAKVKDVFTGIIEMDTVWGEDRSILGGVWIEREATLRIKPGVNIYFLPTYNKPRGSFNPAILFVSGVLSASGTETNPITFTSSKLSPQPGDWGYIKFTNKDDISTLFHCTVEYGSGLFINGSNPLIESSIIRKHSGGGILIQGASPVIRKSKISKNSTSGIFVVSSGSPLIYGNEIYKNGYGVDAEGMIGIVDNPDIDSNYIHDNTEDGIRTHLLNAIVTRNMIESNGGNGLTYIDCEVEVEGDTITRNQGIGISCRSSIIPIPPSGRSVIRNKITENLGGGISCMGEVVEVIRKNIITGNWNFGVRISSGAVVGLGDVRRYDPGLNKIFDNRGGGAEIGWDVINHTSNVIMAQGNFWGTFDPDTIDSHIYDDDEDPRCGMVNFEEYAISGELPDDEIWEGFVYICGDILVPEDITLTIVEGATVCFVANYDINNLGVDEGRGELIVEGNLEVKPHNESGFGVHSERLGLLCNRMDSSPMNGMGCFTTEKTEIASKENKTGILAMTPEFRHCEYAEVKPILSETKDGNLIMTNGKNETIPILFTSDANQPSPSDWYGIELGGLNWEDRPQTRDPRLKTKDDEKKIRSSETCFAQIDADQGLLLRKSRDCLRSEYGGLTRNDMREEREIRYFEIEYAKRGLALCEGEMLSMKDCIFRNNEAGLKLRGNSLVTIKDCVFRDNTSYGIYAGDDVTGTIKDDSLYNNGAGLIVQGSNIIHPHLSPLPSRERKLEEEKILCPELALKGVYIAGNGTGILCGGESKPVIKENKIVDNSEYGVYITDDAQPNLGGKGHNYIYGSGLYDLYNNTDNKIMAKKNYWGTMNIDTVLAHIWDYYDDNSLGIVKIKPLWDGNKGIGGAMTAGTENRFIYFLKHSFPNPFTTNTTISYSIAKPGKVSLNVYDVSGRLVRKLVNERKKPGIYTVKWSGNNENGCNISTGVYFTRLVAGDFISVKKLILVR